MRFFLLAALTAGFALTAFGQSTGDVIKKLEEAMRKELSGATAGPDGTRSDRRGEAERFVVSAPAQLEAAAGSSESYRLDEVLNRVGGYFTSDEVRQEMAALRAAIKKERDEKQNAQLAAINAVLKQAGEAVRNAKSAEDLDETLKSLARYRNFNSGGERYSEEARATANKLQSTIQFVRHWQEYLVARKSENRDRCRQALQNLTSNEDAMDIMPRSQLLAEMEKYMREPRPEPTRPVEPSGEPPTSEEIAAVVAKAKTLDAIPGIIKELRTLQNRARPSSSSTHDVLATTINNLFAIEKSSKEFQAGYPTKLDNPPLYHPDVTSPAVIPLRAQLFLLLLPRYLNVSGDSMPQPSETLQAYLQRMIDAASKRGDGPLLIRAREALRIISGTNFYGAESSAVSSFAAAQNQEAAGQFALAVTSYQQALKGGSDALPVKLIGERLAGLKTAHPAEYEEGMKRFTTSPRWDEPNWMGSRSGPWSSPYPPSAGAALLGPAATPGPSAAASPSPTAKAASSATPRAKRP